MLTKKTFIFEFCVCIYRQFICTCWNRCICLQIPISSANPEKKKKNQPMKYLVKLACLKLFIFPFRPFSSCISATSLPTQKRERTNMHLNGY